MSQAARETSPSSASGTADRRHSGNDTATPIQPQTLRGKKTRVGLIEAAREEFEEVGLSEARVANITRRAEVSYGSFYTYFESKEDIFREVVVKVTGEMFEASARRDPTDSTPFKRLETANRRYLQAYERNAGIMGLIEGIAPYDAYANDLLKNMRNLFIGRIEEGIRRQQEAEKLDPTLDPRVAARILGGMIEQVARASFLYKEPYDEDTVVHTLTTLWSNAIGTVPDH